MVKNAKIVIVLGLLAGSIGALILLRREPEPSYGGRALSDWAHEYTAAYSRRSLALFRPTNVPYTGIDLEAEAAILAIGTNTFPCVLRWLQFEQDHVSVKLFYSLGLNRLPPTLRSRTHQIATGQAGQMRALEALSILQILGPTARAIAPSLLRLGKDPRKPDMAYRAFAALGVLGTNGLPQLMEVLADPNHPYRGVAVRQVQDFLERSPVAVIPTSMLIQCLQDRDASLAILAMQRLCQSGTDRRAGVPALQKNLLNSDPSVRAAASNALDLIQRELPVDSSAELPSNK